MLISCQFAFSYSKIDWIAIEEYLEEIYTSQEVSDALDLIEHYLMRPINLHTAKSIDLAALPTIDIITATKIIEIVSKNPSFSYQSIFDLVELSEIQKNIIYFCTDLNIKNDTDLNRKYKNIGVYRIRNLHRLETNRGLEEKQYKGDELDLYQSLHLNYNGYESQIITNKRIGERSITEFVSGSISYNTDNLNITFGDYRPIIGFGNLFWNSFAIGKGGEMVSSAASFNTSIKSNSSTIAFSYLRGVAISKRINIKNSKLTITTFASNTPRSATIDTASNIATSLYTSNYFRTQNEIDKKNNLDEKSIGTSLVYENDRYTIGSVCLYLDYSKEVASSSASAFNGKSGNLGTIFGFYQFPMVLLGSEITIDNNSNIGLKAVALRKGTRSSVSMHYRYYSAEFRSPFGYNFGEQSSAANEMGLYTGFRTIFTSNSNLQGYLDIYRTITWTYTVQLPIRGIDLAGLFSQKNTILGDFSIRAKYESKTNGLKKQGQSRQTIYSHTRTDLRAEIKNKFHRTTLFRLRFDVNIVDFENHKPQELGFAGYAELQYSPISKLRFRGRYAVFQTDSYSSAIWHFEYRMPSSAAAVALFDEGSRMFFAIDYKLLNTIELYLCYTRLHKPKYKTLGSGYEQIKSNKDNRLYIMAVVKL